MHAYTMDSKHVAPEATMPNSRVRAKFKLPVQVLPTISTEELILRDQGEL